MARTMNSRVSGAKSGQRGFGLLETLIGIVVLMIGLLAVLATFALAIGNTQSVQYDSIARQKAAEAVESIYTARQTSQISFNQIQNVAGAGSPGIFVVGFTPMTDAGPDGLDNTTDDTPAGPSDCRARVDKSPILPRTYWWIWGISAGRFRLPTWPAIPTCGRLRLRCVIRCHKAGIGAIRCRP